MSKVNIRIHSRAARRLQSLQDASGHSRSHVIRQLVDALPPVNAADPAGDIQRYTICLPADTEERLHQIAEVTGRSVSDVVTDALENNHKKS